MGCESANENRHQNRNKIRQTNNITLNETEQAILECKTCRDKIKKYIKKLEAKETKSREKAKELLKEKKRDRAKYYLKQCRLFQEQTKIYDDQLEMVYSQIQNIESTCNLQDCMRCLKNGNEVLQKLQKDVNLEEWENIRDDLNDLKEKDREIDEFFRERGVDEEDFDKECEDELNKLLYEIQGDKQINLPSVPSTKINEDEASNKKNKVKVKSKKKIVNA